MIFKVLHSRFPVEFMIFVLMLSIGRVYAAGPQNMGEAQEVFPDLKTFQWHAGARSCDEDQSPAIQTVQVDASTFVLRQNKCTTFEAPFIYILAGNNTVLVVDTGAIESSVESPVYREVSALLEKIRGEAGYSDMKLLVVHSHSHSDHTKGDSQFAGKEDVELVGTYQSDIVKRFKLDRWPLGEAKIDLGGRLITLLPIPGHQDQSIALYDEQNRWLLTGDTLYPGSIRVKDWDQFKNSIHRLIKFTQKNPVFLVLGSHIEMNAQTNEIYSIGSTYQPNETPLALSVEHLEQLDARLQSTKKSKKLKFESFVIAPLSYFEKMIIKVMSPKKKG